MYLDSATGLPVALAFSTHPNSNMKTDIPVEIRFSDYRQVSGVSVPFHVQKYLNGTPLVDFQGSQASINTGLTDATFQ